VNTYLGMAQEFVQGDPEGEFLYSRTPFPSSRLPFSRAREVPVRPGRCAPIYCVPSRRISRHRSQGTYQVETEFSSTVQESAHDLCDARTPDDIWQAGDDAALLPASRGAEFVGCFQRTSIGAGLAGARRDPATQPGIRVSVRSAAAFPMLEGVRRAA